ncbi:MarR family winged helix-turn-helix transcriptional regulator [Pseudactinotalea terrae]|uniref:MarR family winged helix-turn-helix transcriptional regulator n=1 Tax=Pseudactinotalea terrae TaxID=1743262 RepID=UPI0012E1155D|nr:MarR family winged helix-turn-helix transcriptional regulator [Pseudactinotalea terrae]
MEDEVDRIVDAWRRERPDLDPAPLHVFSRISRLARHLELARRAAFTSRGLEPWSFDVLSALRRAGAPYELTPGVLMSQTLVSSGTMTNRVDRLVAAGLVERHGRPGDRRVVVVRLTEPGKDAVDQAMSELLDYESSLLENLDLAGREALTATLRSLMEPFDS